MNERLKWHSLVGGGAGPHEARLDLGRLRPGTLLVRQFGDRLGEFQEDFAVHFALAGAVAARRRAARPFADDETDETRQR